MYGKSTFITPTPAGFVYAAEYYDFAPNSCICLKPFVSEDQRKRTFAHVYENKLEVSSPIAPFCCLTTEPCMVDWVSVLYFDKSPNRAPCCSCLGRPVIYVSNPKCLCIDMKTCYGQSIKAAPCACFDLKMFLCCGKPCYTLFAMPVVSAVANADSFASALKYAAEDYAKRNQLPEPQTAVFANVEANAFEKKQAKGLQELKMAR